MSDRLLGVIFGGVLPAIFFGLSGFLSKVSIEAGVSTSTYLQLLGGGIVVCGFISGFFLPKIAGTDLGLFYSLLTGLAWALGALLVAVSLERFKTPISILAPIYNTNTLVAVFLGLWIFAEWREVHTTKLLLGSMLIVVGGWLVAKA